MIRRPPRSTHCISSAASDVYKRQIKIYLCGIHYVATVLSHACNLSSMGQLRLLARGIRRSQGRSLRPLRSPITPSHLRRMLYFIQNSRFSSRDKSLWHALILTAFFGQRVSEYTSPSVSSFNSTTNLMASDITFDRPVVQVRLKASKSDPFKTGVSIRLHPVGAVSYTHLTLPTICSV